MSIERAKPPGFLPTLAINIHNLAVRGQIGSSKFGFIKDGMLKTVDLLFSVMGDEDSNRLVELLSGTSKYNPVKDFGCVRVQVANAEFDYVDPKTGFRLKKGQPHLRIHLIEMLSLELSTPKRVKEATESVREMMVKVAEYIGLNEQRLPQHQFLVGITHSKLAKASRRLGFIVPETPLPDRIKILFKKASNPTDSEISRVESDVLLCFVSYEKIKRNFSGFCQK